jgi:enamine deaminase RidA (YjgF/YER057c/UK114 family)
MRQLKPAGVAPPFSHYSHGVEVGAGARWLHISGQVGIDPDGRLATDAAGQMELAWRNVLAILEDARMGPRDLVKVTAFLVRGSDTPLYREVRDRMLDGAEPASTLLIVAGLAHPDWLVEIEAIAARQD